MTPGPHRILVVEDDRSIGEAIHDFLERNGLEAEIAGDGPAADAWLARDAFDLVVLDLMLPGEDGLSICRRLAASGPPVLMVSAVGETTDRIVGLECGAADYLAKPFEPRELLARIRAILRRPQATPTPRGRVLAFAGLRYDLEAATLTDAEDAVITLTAGEMRLLEAFLDRPGRLLSRATILDFTHDAAAEPFDRAVDLAVSRLRRKLQAASGEACIETVRGVGYRFIARLSS